VPVFPWTAPIRYAPTRRMSSLAVRILHDDGALPQVRDDWARLLAVTPLASGFQSYAWFLSCRAALRSEASLFVLVIADGTETVGILPTELGPNRDLRLVGTRVSNYLGPVYRPERLPALVQALARFLAAEREISLLDLAGLRDGSPFLAALRAADIPGWGGAHVVETGRCPYIDLSRGWDAVYAGRSASTRANAARKWKALERLGRLEFVVATDPCAVEAALPVMFELFAARWERRHESSGFAAHQRGFHERAAPALARAGHLELALLRLDGEIVAFHYGVRAGSVTSSYVLSHARPLEVCSPGALLLIRTLEAAGRRRDPEYDFSLGEEAYKDTWATGARGVFRLLRARHGVRPPLAASWRGLASGVWASMRGIESLRRLRREGVRRALLRMPARLAPDAPGLPAGPQGTWNVYRLRAGPSPDVAAVTWRYAEMRARLSPRLLELAVDRTFRGDTLLVLVRRERPVGIAWRATPARSAVVTGGADAGPGAAVYYHPVPAENLGLHDVVRALAGLDASGGPVTVVTSAPIALAGAEHVHSFRGDHRFTGRRRQGGGV